MDLRDKNNIRSFILEQREKVNNDIRKQWDEGIMIQLLESEFYKKSRVIFVFVSFKSEVNTHKIIEHALKHSKIIYVPKIKSKENVMEIFQINSLKDLKTGYFNILEPEESCLAADSNNIDLILMPGVAFDRLGGRVGYGRGFYDEFLRKMDKSVDKIALAYDFQILDKVPMDEFDVKIDGIVTNREIICI
ncbi:MAG: 5-formyltetrahydrofolate cyclo-ligase [Clostridiaceae bacterium]|nr:5-formyltetrahydrofolate cyclo-ligase [Clostridiaceae bacterium]